MGRQMAIRTSVSCVERLCPGVKKIAIRPVDRRKLPAFEAGANVEISVPRRGNDKPTPYSIVSSSDSTEGYEFIVASSTTGKGKNDWLLENLRVGDVLDISKPRKGIEFADSTHGYFIAGGSGITAFLSHFNSVNLGHRSYHLCHMVRDKSASFCGVDRNHMHSLYACQVVTSENPEFEIDHFLENKKKDAPVYVSGSKRLILDVIRVARDLGWSLRDIYWDKYALPDEGLCHGMADQCC